MRRRQAIGAIGAILAAAVAPALIPKERLMSLKLVREVTDDEIKEYAQTPWDDIFVKRHYHGWEYSHSGSGRDYYKPTHPALKAHGDLGVAPTPAEMDMLNMDPNFARPVFVPKEKQLVDHEFKGQKPDLTFKEIREETRKVIQDELKIDISQRELYLHGKWKNNG